MIKFPKPVQLRKEAKRGAHYIRRAIIETTPIITDVKNYKNLVSFTPLPVSFNLSSD